VSRNPQPSYPDRHPFFSVHAWVEKEKAAEHVLRCEAEVASLRGFVWDILARTALPDSWMLRICPATLSRLSRGNMDG
jgi:hypothetical protein